MILNLTLRLSVQKTYIGAAIALKEIKTINIIIKDEKGDLRYIFPRCFC
jgi:hypothetical protein